MTPNHKTQRLSRREWKRRLRNRFWRSRKRYHAAEQKGKNVIRNLHYNAAHHLLRNYKTVILPHTSAQHWIKGKRLTASTKKSIQLLSFGKFASRVVQTATRYPESSVVRGSEAYTSKQCGLCGKINDHLKSSETFYCISTTCLCRADRDIHAARNIFLRFLSTLLS